MTRLKLLAAVSFVTLSLSARADDLVLPGVARANGVGGTRFVSTVWLHNPSDASLAVSLGLVSSGGTAASTVVTLAPRETRRIDDPVGGLFGLESGAGTLTASAPGAFTMRGVTANVADPKGTYGLALVASRASEALLPGETGGAAWLSHTAAPDAGFRTNLAVTLLSPASEALVTILDDAGLVRAETRVASDTPLFWQRSAGDLAADPEIPLGRVEVRVLRGSAVAYTAVVDNVTGDGVLAPARRTDPAAAISLLVPGAARSGGANGTLWRTGLRLVNPTLVPVVASLDGVGLPGAPHAERSVPPGGILEETDLLGALGLPEGSAGSVRLTAAAALGALAVTRNVDPSGKPGTFAASQEPVAADAVVAAGRVLAFVGLSAHAGSSGFRTNVAFLSGPGGAAGSLVLRAPAGSVLTTAPLSLAPSAWMQRSLGDWCGGIAVPDDATLEVRVASGSLTGYASVIDNGTGDPVVLAPASLATSACPPAGAPPTLVPSTTHVTAGASLTIGLNAPGRATGRLLPDDLPLGPGGAVPISPSVTATYRWRPAAGCLEDLSAPVTIEVVAPAAAVMTEQGAVRGTTNAGASAFRGIPFAAPPTGAMRWRPPARAARFGGVLDGTSFGAVCPQLDANGSVTGAEDCLTLNVYAPATTPAEPLPVLFFIHGGGNVQGSSSQAVYDGGAWAGSGRAVVVTANYRLNAFGWLAQPWLSAESRRGVSGNLGTIDQLAALRWVQRNIGPFGGDPSRVTVFGESAGGINVCTLVASPLARGLFARALIESGGCVQRTQADFVTFGSSVTSGAGCASAADAAACMRGLPFAQVLLAVPPSVSITSSSGQLWGPNVDGFVLRDSPDATLAKGEQNSVPFAIGANADETGEAAPAITTEAQYEALVTAQAGALAPLVLAKYPASAYGTPRKAYVAVTTDSRFVCPSRRFARAAAAGGSPKVFRYFFSYPANKLFGAIHASELPFVFGSFSAVAGYTPDAAALALSRSMNAAWAQFAATGEPNGPGLPVWPVYDAASDATMVWNAPSGGTNGIRTALCDFWDSLVGRIGAPPL